MPILPDPVREDIAAQISAHWPLSADIDPSEAAIGLGESLRVMMLPVEQVRMDHQPLDECLIDTGQWHHQLYLGDRALTFARSVADPGERHRIVEVAQSALPVAVQRSIDWVDQHVEARDAEIFFAPAFALAGLIVHGEAGDAVVLSLLPDTIRNLEVNALLEPNEFLALLAMNEPIAGLGPLEAGGEALT